MAYSYTIRTKNINIVIDSNGIVYGTRINTFRAEVFGLVSISVALYHVILELGQACKLREVTIYCDNQQAIRAMNDSNLTHPYNWDSSCHDLLNFVINTK